MTDDHAIVTKPKKKKRQSRADRWQEAAGNALSAIQAIESQVSDFETAVSELRSVQEEYEGWKDALPENLSSSPLGERLQEVCDLDIEDIANSLREAVDEAQGKIEEAESMELPQGWGRD
jgi:hypothetical protein